MQRNILWDEWGFGSMDPYDLPHREFQLHVAVLEGRNMKRKEEAEEAERKSKQAKRG